MWAMRMVHEAGLHDCTGGNSFVTLTYAPEHIPSDWSLNKRDVQLFLKRLRKSRPGEKIKYYHCGEYGSKCRHGLDVDQVGCPLCTVGRPHYHVCLFNCSFNDKEAYATKKDTTYYTSEELVKLWGKGHVDVGELTIQSAGYVARYCLKKVTGKRAEMHYRTVDDNGELVQLEPEYATMSNGLGEGWYERFKDDFFPSDECPVPGEGVYPKVPRYYDEKLRKSDEVAYEAMKAERRKFAVEHADEYTAERLYSKYRVKKAQISSLGRTLE